MTTYLATAELKTSFWLKLLRFFRIKSKREDFEITFDKPWFRIGDMIDSGSIDIKIVGWKKDKPKNNIFCGWFQTINQTNYYE